MEDHKFRILAFQNLIIQIKILSDGSFNPLFYFIFLKFIFFYISFIYPFLWWNDPSLKTDNF